MRALAYDRHFKQAYHDGVLSISSRHPYGKVVVGRRIDAIVLEQAFHDAEVSVLRRELYGKIVIG
jgi:hypothetical protein